MLLTNRADHAAAVTVRVGGRLARGPELVADVRASDHADDKRV